MDAAAISQLQPMPMIEEQVPQQRSAYPKDTEFTVARTFALLLVTLVIPMHLALAMVSFSLGAIL